MNGYGVSTKVHTLFKPMMDSNHGSRSLSNIMIGSGAGSSTICSPADLSLTLDDLIADGESFSDLFRTFAAP